MKKTNLTKINKDNIIDISFEPNKHRLNADGIIEYYHLYSVLEKNSTRKEITRREFIYLLNYPLGLE